MVPWLAARFGKHSGASHGGSRRADSRQSWNRFGKKLLSLLLELSRLSMRAKKALLLGQNLFLSAQPFFEASRCIAYAGTIESQPQTRDYDHAGGRAKEKS